MIEIKTNIPSNIDEDLHFLESIKNDKDSFTDLKRKPNGKPKPLLIAQWNCQSGEIEGVIDE